MKFKLNQPVQGHFKKSHSREPSHNQPKRLISSRSLGIDQDNNTRREEQGQGLSVNTERGGGRNDQPDKLDADEHDEEIAKNKKQILWSSVVLMLLYSAVGVLYLVGVEKWGYLNAWYFIVVTLTTVGYGDQSAWDDDGWGGDGVVWFMSMYALLGIMLVGSALGIVAAELIDANQRAAEKKSRDARNELHSPRPLKKEMERKSISSSLGKASEKCGSNFSNLARAILPDFVIELTPGFLVMICVLIVGMVLIYYDHKESPEAEEPTLAQCFYFAVITGTTIGYGDYSFYTDWGRIVGSFYVLFAVVSIGGVLGDIANYFIEKKQAEALEKVLKKKITVEDFRKFDIDGDGRIEKTEFVLKKLMLMDMIKPEDVERCEEEFEVMDADGSGEITMEDLELYIENRDKPSKVQGAKVDASPSPEEVRLMEEEKEKERGQEEEEKRKREEQSRRTSILDFFKGPISLFRAESMDRAQNGREMAVDEKR
mmetsp:Transcript_4885/g.10235  ORF Transcript_4885/g.10235 Transcript_4885/m.10235 type:complete len:485 (+) Transcript_4885:280-1734(+)|eukprot:CAMPEP_0197560242 /NCGR_PEP_ID=MMETSP1320-20131121/22757_1 /TAXON_ID=91990 /ORGANISM="Bolidomonas sp., Strain RCC2347" /LENGTH=484 /DNA_ID=CAMNT_0043121769 /DNA_START=203 /DNA_END=1657 /DNA_ORIENTATION=-